MRGHGSLVDVGGVLERERNGEKEERLLARCLLCGFDCTCDDDDDDDDGGGWDCCAVRVLVWDESRGGDGSRGSGMFISVYSGSSYAKSKSGNGADGSVSWDGDGVDCIVLENGSMEDIWPAGSEAMVIS
jgi:hypothetical protein